ncbi:MAG: dihydropteroate synthase [Clostridia bacterium]|nr:dihydropteroate synthase [Clostridia bacterium]
MIWHAGGFRIDLSQPRVMGIVNVTPDSFSDGGSYAAARDAISHALRLEQDGADIVDIGGQSTRPGHTPIGADEEWTRIEPVLAGLRGRIKIPISVDTYYPTVAARAIECGASIINDVSGLASAEMRRICADSGVGCVIMHSEDVTSCEDVFAELRRFFSRRVERCIADGIDERCICLDPGIGFGKTRAQEVEILHHMELCRVRSLPLLAAASRKRVIEYVMNGCCGGGRSIPPEERDEATFEMHRKALRSGAQIIRQHVINK